VESPPPDESKKPASRSPANLSAEQLRALLSSDFKGGRPPAQKQSGRSSRRQIIWAGVILLAGLLYAILRFTSAPSKVIVVNTSGEDAASVILISGTQRIDIGGVGNGEVRKVELMPGKPLRVEYTFDQQRVWNDSEPLAAFHSLTLFIDADRKLRVVREAPWARAPERPAIQRPAAR
jgi:hypothetical protein